MTQTFHAAEAYRRTAVQSASPMQLVVMLYDGALRFLAEARDAHARGDVAARAVALGRVLDIVAECQNTLNMEQGASIAQELDRLYSYIVGRLLDVNVKRDTAAIDEVTKLMATLRDAWAQAATQDLQAVALAAPAYAAAGVAARR